jgi:NADH:ubiquinone oxidoreductase subunit 4 (subunit M)
MTAGIFFLGIYPQPLIRVMDKSMINIVQLALQAKF